MGDRETRARDGEAGAGAMRKRRTTLADGRYLIYYTFVGAGDATHVEDGGARAKAEPEAEPSAGEEESV